MFEAGAWKHKIAEVSIVAAQMGSRASGEPSPKHLEQIDLGTPPVQPMLSQLRHPPAPAAATLNTNEGRIVRISLLRIPI
eukprot:2396145-Amphidinium_carterae.1